MNNNQNPKLNNTPAKKPTPNAQRQAPAAQRTGEMRRVAPEKRMPTGEIRRVAPEKRMPTGEIRRPVQNPAGEARPKAEPRVNPTPKYPTNTKKKNLDDYLVWFLILAVVVLVALVVTYCIITFGDADKPDTPDVPDGGSVSAGLPGDGNGNNDTTALYWAVVPSNQKAFVPKTTSSTLPISASDIYSAAAIMVDLASGEVVCQYNPDTVIYPASLTKIMTVIVACENLKSLTAREFKLTQKAADRFYNEGASQAYFALNTGIANIDLVYGAILPSGADACLGLCEVVAKTEADFVKLMNEKAAAMGCTNTHFTNATGLHDDSHYSTARDIATMLAYAMQNPFIKQVLSATSYESTSPIRSDSGSNRLSCIWASRVSGNESSKATMFAAKTGYTPEAAQCLASVSKTVDGREYAIVTVGAAALEEGESSRPLPFKDAKFLLDTYIN